MKREMEEDIIEESKEEMRRWWWSINRVIGERRGKEYDRRTYGQPQWSLAALGNPDGGRCSCRLFFSQRYPER